MSDETKAKIGAARKGRKMSDETKAKISAANKGNVCSDLTKAKISRANKGKKRSDEFRAMCSKNNNGYNGFKKSENTTPKIKPKVLSNEEFFALAKSIINNEKH